MFQLNVLFYFDNFAGKKNLACKCIHAKNVPLKFWELSLWCIFLSMPVAFMFLSFKFLCILALHICVFVMNSSQFYQVSEIFRHASISSVAGLLSNLRSSGIYMFYSAVIAYNFQLS